MRITVESWNPEYAPPIALGPLEPSEATVDPNVEVPASDWAPLDPARATTPAARVIFIDGVRRIDAFAWITGDDELSRAGICASYAAGTVRAEMRATVERAEVRRGLFAMQPIEPLVTRAGTYQACPVASSDPDQLSLGLQQRLGELEVQIAAELDTEADLIVVDGPLSGRQNVPSAVGYVKTHRVSYLPDRLARIVSALRPGQRTPLFLSTTSWTRYSWYLRLPGPKAHPWAGVVRLECDANATVADAAAVADRTAVTIPRYASQPHKDPRAPQNLFPIGGLERELRHRLGDASLLHNALRLATGFGRGRGLDRK